MTDNERIDVPTGASGEGAALVPAAKVEVGSLIYTVRGFVEMRHLADELALARQVSAMVESTRAPISRAIMILVGLHMVFASLCSCGWVAPALIGPCRRAAPTL